MTGATVDPKSRYNIWVDTVRFPGCPRDLADAAVSTTITADVPVIAERDDVVAGTDRRLNWAEAHNARRRHHAPATSGRLADGEQGGPRTTETYILIANTSAYPGPRGSRSTSRMASRGKNVPLPANSRTNVPVGAPARRAASARPGQTSASAR